MDSCRFHEIFREFNFGEFKLDRPIAREKPAQKELKHLPIPRESKFNAFADERLGLSFEQSSGSPGRSVPSADRPTGIPPHKGSSADIRGNGFLRRQPRLKNMAAQVS